jgi:hypothetical protein
VAGAPAPAAAGSSQSLALPSGHKRRVGIRAVDEQGNVGRVSVIDTQNPLSGGGGTADVVAPVASIAAPTYSTDITSKTSFKVRWSADDGAGSGVDSFTVDVRRVVPGARAGAAPPYHTLVRNTTHHSVTFRGHPGATYLFRVRARDKAGNVSAAELDRTIVPLGDQSRQLHYSRGWRHLHRNGAYTKTITRATRRGPTATLHFKGTKIAVLVTRLRKGGRMQVSVGGRRRTVSLRASRTKARSIVYRSRLLASGTHTITIRALGGGPIELDGFGILP